MTTATNCDDYDYNCNYNYHYNDDADSDGDGDDDDYYLQKTTIVLYSSPVTVEGIPPLASSIFFQSLRILLILGFALVSLGIFLFLYRLRSCSAAAGQWL